MLVHIKKTCLILLILIISNPLYAAGANVKWITFSRNFSVSSTQGFQNIYLDNDIGFEVSSLDNSYQVEVTISPAKGGQAGDWDQYNKDVKMDEANEAVGFGGSENYAAAFDVAVTDENGNWQSFKTGGENILHLTNQSATSGRVHELALAFILVDDYITIDGQQKSTSGTPGVRRFKRLPDKSYNTDITITVTEEIAE